MRTKFDRGRQQNRTELGPRAMRRAMEKKNWTRTYNLSSRRAREKKYCTVVTTEYNRIGHSPRAREKQSWTGGNSEILANSGTSLGEEKCDP